MEPIKKRLAYRFLGIGKHEFYLEHRQVKQSENAWRLRRDLNIERKGFAGLIELPVIRLQ